MDYRTKTTFLGLPLLHIATVRRVDGRPKRGIARGWIAIGDIAFGVIFSFGGLAVGGLAVGGLAIGGLSLAGLAVGFYALGGGAVGIEAIGGGALAWKAAFGGLAVAQTYAQGGSAIAEHANDLIAQDYFTQSLFFSQAETIRDHSRWFLLLVLLPAIQGLYRWFKQRNATE